MIDYILSIVNILSKKIYNFFMNIGEKIKDLRLYNSLSQYELSKKADISRSVLSAYENNMAIPTATVIARIAVALNVSSDYLLGLEDDFGARTATNAAPMGERLTEKEKALLEAFRQLLPETQDFILRSTQGMNDSNPAKKFKKV